MMQMEQDAMMHIEDQKAAELKEVVGLIHLTPGAEIVRATPDHIVFCSHEPRRTFEIRREATQGFRVEEIRGSQSAGRHRRLASCDERITIDQSQMTEWVIGRLEEVRASSFFSGGLCLPEATTLLLMLASALITIGSSIV
jgi:hypothetical protein